MDQTQLSFDFSVGLTYAATGSKDVWLKSNGSGLEKRQATVQLNIFADERSRVKPMIVFKGVGTQIMKGSEPQKWDPRVKVRL